DAVVGEASLGAGGRYAEEAGSAGARVGTGGARVREDSGGWCYPPTVVTDVREDMALARWEIFGPVVVVLPVDGLEDAIRLANDTPYGLAATIWSRDIDDALTAARAVRAGAVAINGDSEGDITTPRGGSTA